VSGLQDFADEAHELAEIDQLTQRLAVARAELKTSKASGKRLATRVGELEHLLDRIAQVRPEDMAVPPWLRPAKATGQHRGTAVLMLSDLHLDEVVDLHEMDGLNRYDRDIAEARLERVVNGTVSLMQDYVAGLDLDGIVVALNGDIITGDIHDELARTNTAPVPATIAHWVPRLASALTHLADAFGNVFVPTADGNHDRTYKKTPAKQRAESSNAWIIYNWLADTLRHDDRIKFSISTAPAQRFDVYSTRFLLTHGDAFRSAGGVGGLYPSMLKYLLRMHQLYSTARDDFDVALLGHWHQYLTGKDFVVNGSLKGYDEYARSGGFTFERPQQALFVVTPENGITQSMPVFADDPVAEGWRRRPKKGARRG
jgi:predicted phosphodiesterase